MTRRSIKRDKDFTFCDRNRFGGFKQGGKKMIHKRNKKLAFGALSLSLSVGCSGIPNDTADADDVYDYQQRQTARR